MNIDINLFRAINDLAGRSGIWDRIAALTTDYSLYVFAVILLFLFLFRRKIFWPALLAGIFARGILTEIIRYLYDRPRPFIAMQNVHVLIDKDGQEPSFPSGHAAFFFAIAFAVFAYDKKLGLIFMALAVIFSLVRIYVGVHYPLDILGGAAVGLVSVWLVQLFFSRRVGLANNRE